MPPLLANIIVSLTLILIIAQLLKYLTCFYRMWERDLCSCPLHSGTDVKTTISVITCNIFYGYICYVIHTFNILCKVLCSYTKYTKVSVCEGLKYIRIHKLNVRLMDT